MNIADVEDRMRAVYAATDGLYRGIEVLPAVDPAAGMDEVHTERDSRSVPHLVDPAPQRAGRDRKRVHIFAAVAAVAVVVAGVATLASRGQRDHTPAVRASSYPTSYLFTDDSVPHYQLAERWFDRNGQHYIYQGPRNHGTYTTMWMTTFRPDEAALAVISRLPKVTVGGADGYQLPPHHAGTPLTPLDKILGDATYKADRLLWPVGNGQWSSEAAQVDHHGAANRLPGPTPSLISDIRQLASIAASVVPAVDVHVAAVKIGYLPSSLAFDTTVFEGGISDGLPANPMTFVDPFAGHASMSFVDRTRRGTTGEDPQRINVVMTLHPAIKDLATAHESELPVQYAPWSKTSIHGLPAWVSRHAILVQMSDGAQVGVVNGPTIGPKPSDSSAQLNTKQLRRIAESLSRDTTGGGTTPYSLTDAVPASALR